MPVSDREGFARWARNGVPGFLAVALFVAIVVHVRIGGSWKDSRAVRRTGGNPACDLYLYVLDSQSISADPQYAAQLGLVSPKVATDNYPSFSIFMLIVILMSVGISSFVKLQ